MKNDVNFGLGSRKCTGEAIGKTEMFLINAFLLQRFKFEKCHQDDLLDFVGVPGITWHPKPFSVRVTTRC